MHVLFQSLSNQQAIFFFQDKKTDSESVKLIMKKLFHHFIISFTLQTLSLSIRAFCHLDLFHLILIYFMIYDICTLKLDNE